jgi:hypothetical protein
MEILEIKTFNDDGGSLSIKVTAEEEIKLENTGVVKVTLVINNQSAGTITFDPTNDLIQLSGLSGSVANYTTCLVACGLGHLVSDILDCRRRGKTNAAELIACLKKKAHRLSLNLINCAVGCSPAAMVS